MSEKKTDWGGIAIVAGALVAAYLLTRPAPAAAPTITPAQAAASYLTGQGNVIATQTSSEVIGKTVSAPVVAGEPSAPAPSDPTQTPIFHFSTLPEGVKPTSGEIVGVQVPRPWAGLTGDGLYNKALDAPLYWEGIPEGSGKIFVPEKYRAIIEKYGIATLRDMRSPADPAYAEIEKQYGRETANLMIRYALELSNGTARGYTITYVSQQDIRNIANKVDERFLTDWMNPKNAGTHASQMHLTLEQYQYAALRYFYEIHGYIPDEYKITWAILDAKYHDSFTGFPAAYEKTYSSPSGSGIKYTAEQYQATFGRPPGWFTPTKIGTDKYVWSDPQKPGSILTGSYADYQKSMADVEKAKAPKPGIIPYPTPTPEPKIVQPIEKAAEKKEAALAAPPERRETLGVRGVVAGPPTSKATVTPAKGPEPVSVKAPTSTPVNPRAQEATRAAVAQQDRTRQVEAKERVAATIERINAGRAVR